MSLIALDSGIQTKHGYAPAPWAIQPALTTAPELWRGCIWSYAPFISSRRDLIARDTISTLAGTPDYRAFTQYGIASGLNNSQITGQTAVVDGHSSFISAVIRLNIKPNIPSDATLFTNNSSSGNGSFSIYLHYSALYVMLRGGGHGYSVGTGVAVSPGWHTVFLIGDYQNLAIYDFADGGPVHAASVGAHYLKGGAASGTGPITVGGTSSNIDVSWASIWEKPLSTGRITRDPFAMFRPAPMGWAVGASGGSPTTTSISAPYGIRYSNSAKIFLPETIALFNQTTTQSDETFDYSSSRKTQSDNTLNYNNSRILSKTYNIPESVSLIKQVSNSTTFDTRLDISRSQIIPYANTLFKTISNIIPISWQGVGSINIFKTLPVSYLNLLNSQASLNTQNSAPVSDSQLLSIAYQLTQTSSQGSVFDSKSTLNKTASLPLAYQGTGAIEAFRAFQLAFSEALESKQTLFMDHKTLIQNFNQIPFSNKTTNAITAFNSIPYETKVIKEVSRQLNFKSLSSVATNSFDIPYSFLLAANITVTALKDMPVNWRSELRKYNIIPIEYDNAFIVPVVDDPSRIWQVSPRDKTWMIDNRNFVWIILK